MMGTTEHLVPLGRLVKPDPMESRDHRVHAVHEACQESKATGVNKETKETLEILALMVQRETEVNLEVMAWMGIPVSRVREAQVDNQDLLVQLAGMVQKAK